MPLSSCAAVGRLSLLACVGSLPGEEPVLREGGLRKRGTREGKGIKEERKDHKTVTVRDEQGRDTGNGARKGKGDRKIRMAERIKAEKEGRGGEANGESGEAELRLREKNK